MLNPLEHNELQKAMMLRGFDYETSELIIRDFRWRCVNLLKKMPRSFEVNIEDLPFLWRAYALEKDENMTRDAQELAANLRAAIAEINGITRERYHEIMHAEREGRLVILPVSFAEFNSKVGDDIYVIDDEEIIEATLCYFIFDQNCKVQGLAIYGCVGDEDFEAYEFSHDDLGKTVFLTREEAEKVLEDNDIG